jgi:phosphoadenosine phosphosulfate reductase
MSQPAAKVSSSDPLSRCAFGEVESSEIALAHCNARFQNMDARERVQWALENLPGQHILSSSFGAQSAVALHLLTRERPDIPVVLIDTGYLFPETYRFIDELVEKLRLNLAVYRARQSPAWQEARHGQRWLQGAAGLDAYNDENKVEPMKRALQELDAGTWFAGLRRTQASTRAKTPFLDRSGDRWKVHPIVDWTDRDVHFYLKRHGLPYHPLWEKGYLSIGDVHTTRSIHEVDELEQTRFFGARRECGLHEIDLAEV